MTRPVLLCSGRAVDYAFRPRGARCPNSYTLPENATARIDVHARAAHWRVGVLPDGSVIGSCPRCSTPRRAA